MIVLATLTSWFFLYLYFEDKVGSGKEALRLAAITPLFFMASTAATILFFPVIGYISTLRWLEKEYTEVKWRDFAPQKKSRTT
jgi:hypothetical protein